MTDRPQEPTLSPEDDARVRRLLAEARHTEPMPAAVVERLDDVLADLHARRTQERRTQERRTQEPRTQEPRTQERQAVVVDLAARRRRKAASLLVAAAAVVVVGVGLGQVLPTTSGGDDAATQAEAGGRADAQADGGGAGAGADKNSDSSSSVAPGSEAPQENLRAEVTIRPAHFGADVRKARGLVATEPANALGSVESFVAADPVCGSGIVGDGTVVTASYDGAASVLVLRPPAGDVQVVDLYLCEATEPLRSITLTVP